MSEEAIFAAALELPSGERAAYLAQACGGDTALRKRLEGLLTASDRAGAFMARPAVEEGTEFIDPGSTPNDATVTRAGPDRPAADEDEVPLGFLQPATRPDSLGRIGHYEVLQVLGHGGFGIVFRAFDDVLHRVVAVKVLAPQLAATSPARKRFLREARSSAQVRHENVVQVYQVGESPLPYIAMEFIPGETLQQRLDRTGPVDPAEVVRVGRQVAEGLAAAHANDLIHRDIKPGNILLEGGAQHRVKITDFGLARAADDASISQSGIIAGTPMYMAPEQAKGEKLDRRADLFSLGSVLYQMAAGRPPFRANGTVAVLKRVAEDAPRDIREIIPETPQWLCDIIAKLHAKDPDDRYQSAREVADVLADCEAQLKAGSKLRDFSRIPRGKARRSGRRTRVAAAAVLLLPVIALAATEFAGVTHLFRDRPSSHDPVTPGVDPAPAVVAKPDPPTAVPAGPSLKQTLIGHAGRVDKVVFSPDGRLLASAGVGAVYVWDAQSGAPRHTLPMPTAFQSEAIAFSPDSKWLVTSPVDDKTAGDISVWNVDTGKLDGTLVGHTQGNFGLSFSPDGNRLVSGGWDTVVRLWDFAARREVGTITPPNNRWMRDVVVSPAGTIAVGSDKVFLFRADGSLARTIDTNAGPLGFSPDGRYLAGSTWKAGVVTVWDADTGEEIASWRAHGGTANDIAFSGDGNVLASAGGDGKVRLWDVKTQRPLAELPHEGVAYGVAFSPDGVTLATSGLNDRLVKLWDVSAVLAEQRKSRPRPAAFPNGLGMEFVRVPKGKSWLGGGKDKLGDREVEIPADFYLGKYEVTQGEWEAVMGENPSHFSRTGDGREAVKDVSDADLKRFPVENVSWDQCQAFVAKLNELQKESGWVYRLPTEVEWEYACRGGPMADRQESAFDFYFARPASNLLLGEANYMHGKGPRTCKVKSYEANRLGLYDMHGNVWEWCYDSKGGAAEGSDVVSRGGSWSHDSVRCQAAYRYARPPSSRYSDLGLRLARVPADAASPEVKTQSVVANVPNDAVLLMNFEKDSFYEKDGKTYARDLSGNGNDGLCDNVAFTPDGKAGGGLLCKEGEGRLQLAKSLILRQPNYTITAWCRWDTRTGPGQPTPLYRTSRPDRLTQSVFDIGIPLERSVHVNAWNLNLQPKNWKNASTNSRAVPPGWFFVAVSLTDGEVDNGKLRIVIDDTIQSRTSQMVATGNPVVDFIGHNMAGAVIDELAVFQRALSDEEIAAVRALGMKGTPMTVGKAPPAVAPFTDADVKRIAALPAAEQVEEVRKELVRRNPGFDGTVGHTIENGAVTKLRVVTDRVTDITPIRAFNALQVLDCSGTMTGQPNGQLAHLPLEGLNLTVLARLNLGHTRVGDAALAPFRDCRNLLSLHLPATQVGDPGVAHFKDCKNLVSLGLSGTRVTDAGLAHFAGCKDLAEVNLAGTTVGDAGLAHLKDCKGLKSLYLVATQVSDAGLAQFGGCTELTTLDLTGTQVSEAGLAHLKGCQQLTRLVIRRTRVADLSPLRGLPLRELDGDFQPDRDAEVLRSIQTLEKINGKPVAEFWKGVAKE